MAALAPAPILSTVLAELAHDWAIRYATGRLNVTLDEADTLASALRELAASARMMSQSFARVVAERNDLLAIANEADLIRHARAGAPAPVPTGNVIDLTAIFARERAATAARPEGGAS